MKSVVAYVRSLLGWSDDEPALRPSFKRDRSDDDFSTQDDTPALKKLRQLKRTSFPDIMATNDIWGKEEKSKNVRYVPIQIEAGYPSTSTPNNVPERLSGRMKTIPVKIVGVSENGPSTPHRKPRMHTPLRSFVHAVVDEDDEEPEVTWVESKPQPSKRPSKVYINLDDEENGEVEEGDEVIFVKKVTTPPPVKPYKFFINKDVTDSRDGDSRQYYNIVGNTCDRPSKSYPKTCSKFRAPPGITKTYKKAPTPLPKWLQAEIDRSRSPVRNRYVNLNGNGKSAISEVFNLDEKRNYRDLIERVAGTTKRVSLTKPLEVINLTEEAASFRNTQRAQKQALNEIKLLESGLVAEKESEATTEYDPVTVASINSSDSEVEIIPSGSSTSSLKIDPINSLKDSNKDNAVTANNWLANLESKYKKKKQEAQEKLRDVRRESDIISKVNYEQKLAHLEYKLKHELSIPESLIEEPQPTVELPPLSPEQEKLVNRALGPGPPGQLLVEKFNLRIHRRDLQTLAGLNWLNDEVINFYMNLLMQRSEERKDLPKVYATNTFFYPKLMQSGQAGLRRWTRKIENMRSTFYCLKLPHTIYVDMFFKGLPREAISLKDRVDIFAHELLVVPVHLGVHWCLSLVDFRVKRVQYLDSMGGRNQACLDALLQYLRDEHQDKKGQAFDDEGWRTECLKNIPQQMNGSDCGMFACTFAEFSSRNAPYTFEQGHMPYLRRKAALEILRGKLLL